MSEVCLICPRRCGVDRIRQLGFCASPRRAVVSRAAPHYGEEPCISGSRGSGTVFFSGCNLRCVFCQNYQISRGGAGKEVSTEQLREIFLRLRDQGVHNINLVTPTHYSYLLADVLSGLDLGIPVVWNSSGYESVEQLRALEGLVQVYMPDIKYSDCALALRWSQAADYPATALAAVKEMYRQTGPFVLDEDGIMQRGVLIRHLIMPGHAENTLGVIDMVEDNLPAENIMFSLMSQYTPMPAVSNDADLSRTVTAAEYERCRSYLDFSAIEHGYFQSPEAATDEMIPDFDGSGVDR